MKPEEQRIKIAEACGWNDIRTRPAIPFGGDKLSGIPIEGRAAKILLDYLNDLNAMHEAEKVLTRVQKREYHGQLCEVQKAEHGKYVDGTYLISATASQRAEAFLRTLNLWTP